MSETNIDIDLSTGIAVVNVAVGDLFDASGDVIEDTVASGEYSVADDTLATLVSQDGAGNAVLNLLLVDGVETVNFTGETATGAQITGEATITITGTAVTTPTGPSAAVTVQLNLSATEADGTEVTSSVVDTPDPSASGAVSDALANEGLDAGTATTIQTVPDATADTNDGISGKGETVDGQPLGPVTGTVETEAALNPPGGTGETPA